jgi:hypothetical protein
MAVHAIVISKHPSLFCEKWLSDSVIFYSEYSALNICYRSHPRVVRQIIRDMTYSLTLIGKKYFANSKEAGRGMGKCYRGGEEGSPYQTKNFRPLNLYPIILTVKKSLPVWFKSSQPYL